MKTFAKRPHRKEAARRAQIISQQTIKIDKILSLNQKSGNEIAGIPACSFNDSFIVTRNSKLNEKRQQILVNFFM